MSDLRFYEFFAGGGMARLGLGPRWRCVLSNDFDAKKAASYRANFGACPELVVEDVAKLTADRIRESAQLAWASFPCQDLSVAGYGAGLRGARSGAFWSFWRLIEQLKRSGCAPPVIAIENVVGTLTSHGGSDFAQIAAAIASAGYDLGALVIDAKMFVPQSRPRLFVVASRRECPIPAGLTSASSDPIWHPTSVVRAHDSLPRHVARNWRWWNLPAPPRRTTRLVDILELEPPPRSVGWHTDDETQALLKMMSAKNRTKVRQAQRLGQVVAGTIYRRTRTNEIGLRVQRAEVRFDGVAGCLRTPAGGSSRQIVLIVRGASIRSRLMTPREVARLMGLPDQYVLPARYNEAYHLAGDGVAVPVVQFLAAHLLEPLVAAHAQATAVAA